MTREQRGLVTIPGWPTMIAVWLIGASLGALAASRLWYIGVPLVVIWIAGGTVWYIATMRRLDAEQRANGYRR